jgi:hypothetical protein
MIQTITLSDFRTAFHNMGRKDQFSYEGLELIFDYIESYEQDTGEQIELDVIALCCEWSEDTPENIAAAYDIDLEGKEGAAALMHVYDYLIDGIDGTQVAGVTDSGTVVYVQF